MSRMVSSAGWGHLRFPANIGAIASWQTLPAGAGGFNQGMSIAGDNSLIIRTDTYGAYKWNPSATAPNGQTGVWKQLVTSQSMPSDYVNGGVCGAGGQGPAVGVYEIQICYLSSNIIYMMFNDIESSGTNNSTVFKSSDGGASWTRTAFTPIASSSAPPNEGTYKEWGPKMAIDPSNANKVYVGTKSSGLFLTTDGNSFNAVSTGLIPLATGPAGYTGMCISKANSNNIFIWSDGNGCYGSTNGGTSFTHLTTGTGPATGISRAAIDEATGNYWAVDNEADLWRWNGTTWAKLITGGVKGFAIDPATSGHLVAWSDQNLNETQNSNATTPTWSGFTTGFTLGSTGDVGWIGGYGTPSTLDGAGYFDQILGNNTIYAVGDKGTYKTMPWTTGSLGSTANWNAMSRGIEQLVGIDVVVPPNTGVPLACGWDFGLRYMSSLTSYTSTFKPFYHNFTAVWSCDYAAADSSYRVVMLANGEYGGGGQNHSYSDDGGQTWTSFVANMPLATSGGTIAASTLQNWVFQDCSTRQMYFTLNAGSSWSAASPSAHSGSPLNAAGRWIVADRVNANQFTAMLDSGTSPGFYTTSNGGTTWTGPLSVSDVEGGGAQMHAVPGQANHIWISSGQGGSYGGVGGIGGSLKYSANAGSTWTTVTNFAQSYSVGFGKASVSYPNVFVAGWARLASGSTVSAVTGSNINFSLTGSPAHTILAGAPVVMDDANGRLIRGSVVSYSGGVLTVNIDTVLSGSGSSSSWNAFIFGIWMTTGGQTSAPIWQQIGAYPANSMDVIQGINGDMTKLGRCYIAQGGSGYKYYG